MLRGYARADEDEAFLRSYFAQGLVTRAKHANWAILDFALLADVSIEMRAVREMRTRRKDKAYNSTSVGLHLSTSTHERAMRPNHILGLNPSSTEGR